MKRNTSCRTPQRSAQGFTLIEVMISIVVVAVGVLALATALAGSITATQSAQYDLIARQKALEAMESIYTARNDRQITFSQIANIASGGIFTGSATQMLSAGADGLVNTSDDANFPASGVCPAGPECIPLPGSDGVLGTADDVPMRLSNFTRQITIGTVLNADGTIDPNLKQITVIVRYTSGNGILRDYTVNGLISTFR